LAYKVEMFRIFLYNSESGLISLGQLFAKNFKDMGKYRLV